MASIVEIADRIKAVVEANATTVTPQIKKVVYGDVDVVTDSVTVCVAPDSKSSTLHNSAPTAKRSHTVMVTIYFAFQMDPEYNHRQADVLAETLETILNADHSINGLVTFGMVSALASGYVRKSGELVRTSRLTITAESYDRI